MELEQYLFQDEAFRGERTALKFRWVLIAVVLIFILITFIRGHSHEALLSFIPAGIFLIYNVFLSYLVKRGNNLYFLRYFSVSIDILALSSHIYINSVFFSSIAVSTTASIFIYPVLMFLSVLRYDKKLIIYATLLTLFAFNLNYILRFHSIEKELIALVISSDPMGQVYKSGYLAILGYFFLKIPDMVYRYIQRQKQILEEKNEYIINLLLEKREKKELKSALKELNELHEQLKLKTDQIEAQNDKLTGLIKTKDKLISFISHDLKNSFSTMSSIIETTRDNLPGLNGQDLLDAMDVLHRHSQTNHILFENLLQWARLQRGQITVNKQKVNVNQICQKAFHHNEPALHSKNLDLQLNLPASLIVLADPILLESVCNNLIGNAIKYSYRGGKILISAEISGKFTNISLADQGTGIRKEKLDGIFNIEKASSSEGTEGEKGSGFGLILCKELIERNGGQLTIISKEGEGTTLIISLIRAE
jgi:signal transduction histidine kinase